MQNENNETYESGELKIEAKGDFDTRRISRGKSAGNKHWKIIVSAIICWIMIVVVILWVAIGYGSKNQTDIDESNVKADVALDKNTTRDDGIRQKMEELEANKKFHQPVKLPAVNTDVNKKIDQKEEKAQEEIDIPIEPIQRQEENLFTSVNRFNSGGLSAGSNVSTSAGARYEDDADIAKIREFAEAGASAQTESSISLTSTRSGLSDLTSSAQYPQTKAYRIPDRKFLLKRRTSFQCVLYNGIKTDYAGFVTCHLTRPLYSADGSIILAEAGAELLGEQKVEIKGGQSSVFTSWTDLETVRGIRASLNGLGTDSMGRSGTAAYVDNHYGKRFGGAVMLAFIQDALKSAANATQKSSDNGYTVNNSEQNVENMATKALENNINIPPTGYVLPGTVINVIVAQDIDFSTVFSTR